MDRFLSKLSVFRTLPPQSLPELFRSFLPRRYRKDEPVFMERQRADAVYLLKSGLVKAVKHSARAGQASMELIAPGQLFGMIAVLDEKPYPVSAIPISACEAYRIPASVFSSLMARHPDFARQVLASVGEHLRQAQELRALSSESVERRIAHLLLALSASVGKDLPVRREDIAELAGCTPETAIRTLAAFRRKGLIASGWKRITISSPAKLQAIAQAD